MSTDEQNQSVEPVSNDTLTTNEEPLQIISEQSKDESGKPNEPSSVEPMNDTEPIQNASSNSIESTEVEETNIVESKQDEEPKVTEPNQKESTVTETKQNKACEVVEQEVSKNNQPNQINIKQETSMDDLKKDKVIKKVQPTAKTANESTKEKSTPKEPTMHPSSSHDVSNMYTKSTPEKSVKPQNIYQDCRVLLIKKGIPGGWNFQQVKQLLIKNVMSIDLGQKSFFVVMLNDTHASTGASNGQAVIKFTNTEDAQAVFRELKKDRRFWVDYDYGGKMSKKVKFTNKSTFDGFGEDSTVINKYELIKKKHDEVFHETTIEESERYYEELPPKRMRQEEMAYTPYRKVFFPPAPENHDTYGLRRDFLNALNIQTPLSNKVFLTSLDPRVDEGKLHEIFSLAGQVMRVNFKFKPNGIRKRSAFVEFDHPVEAVQAISMFRGKFLYDKPISISMEHPNIPRVLPIGLTEIGAGLGHDGSPMRGVRIAIELQKIKETLLDTGKIENVAMKTEHSPFANPIQLGQVQVANSDQSQPNQINQSSAVNQNSLINALTTLSQQPNLLVGLGALANAQGLLQQGAGDLTGALAAIQGQNVSPSPTISPSMAPRHNAAHMTQSTPQMTQHAPQVPHQNKSQFYPGHNATAQGYNATPHGYNVLPLGHSAPPLGHSAPPLGHRPQAPAFIQNTPQPVYQATFTQNTIENDWNTQSQPAQSQQVQYESEPVMYNNMPQTSYNNNQQQYDKYGKDNIHSLDIRRSGGIQKEDDSDKKSDMLVFSNLPSSVNVQALNGKMREVGELSFGELTGKGGAVVRFKHSQDAERCIKLFNRSKVDGQIIEVRYF